MRRIFVAPRGLRSLLLGLGFLVAGCGYQTDRPVARAPGATSTQFVVVAREERKAQLLKEFLDAAMDQVGVKPRIEGIALTLDIQTQELSIRRDETPSRARIFATVRYIVTQRPAVGGGELPPLRGAVRVTEGYNYVDSEFFATDVSREAAERRLMQEAAGQIARRLRFAPQTGTQPGGGEMRAFPPPPERIGEGGLGGTP